MNTLKINGTTLTGIYVDAAVSFNKPAKRVSEYSIPGRNGNLVIDEGTFDNVLISYPVYEKNTFPTEFDNLVNWLASLEGYQRIECSNDPQQYRLGRFVVPETPTAKRLNKDGYYTLVFDCKPQRYLLSGEVETEITNSEVVIASDTAPYLFRKSGGAQDITGADRLDLAKITGGTVAWNQLARNGNFGSVQTWSLYSASYAVSNNEATITNSATNGAIFQNISCVASHKYLFAASLKNGTADGVRLSFAGTSAGIYTATSYGQVGKVISVGSDGNKQLEISVRGAASTVGYAKDVVCVDLTQAFGSTIADYLYTLESGTAGAGIAKLKEWGFLTKPYYAYDAGSLQSVNASEHRTTGKNLVSEMLEGKTIGSDGSVGNNASYNLALARVISGQTYVASGVGANLVAGFYTSKPTLNSVSYNGSRTVASVMSFTAPIDGYIAIRCSTSDTTPQVEFGSTATAYEPYTLHTYALDSSLTLRGIPKLDANNNLYYDGDTYESDGKVTRKYGIRAYASGDATDGSTMITDGTNTVYKLTTPTEETAEGYTNPQVVDVDGTEEFVDYGVAQGTRDVAIPVGHDSDYYNALGYIITNPTYFASKPKIRVYGSGTFTVGNMTITVAAHSQPYIDIDSETETCEYDGTNMSQYVTLSSNDYPELAAGQNGIMPTPGITKLGVTPRWWIL